MAAPLVQEKKLSRQKPKLPSNLLKRVYREDGTLADEKGFFLIGKLLRGLLGDLCLIAPL